MARDEWKFVTSNPEAAMARGRKDYDFSDANTGWKQTLADFEEMEELSETMGPGRKALWNVTKGISYWNRRTSTNGESMLCTVLTVSSSL